MTIIEFESLPLKERIEYTWNNSKCFRHRRINKDLIVNILVLDNYYVEAIYNLKKAEVLSLKVIRLEQWIKYVDIHIMKNLHPS